MLTTKGKRLAGGAATYKVNFPLECPEIEFSNILFDRLWPMRDRTNPYTPILANCIAAPTISLDHLCRVKSGFA